MPSQIIYRNHFLDILLPRFKFETNWSDVEPKIIWHRKS